MSLINEMLRNLEAKRPDDLLRQNLQKEIRSLPPALSGPGRLFKPLLLAGLPLLGIAAVGLYATGQLLPRLGIQTEPASTTVAAVVPAVTILPPPVALVAVDAPAESISSNLHVARELAFVPTPVAALLPPPDPAFAPAPPVAAANVVAGSEKTVTEPTNPITAPPVGPVKIEKSPVLATPRDWTAAEYRRAEGAIAAGRSPEAIEVLRGLLKNDPLHVPARQALLRQLLEARKFNDAIAVLHEGLEVLPNQIGWAMSLARLQFEQGDVAAADQTLTQSQPYADASADYAGFQGHLKSRLGLPRPAVAHYLRATRLAAGEGRWWLGLGLALEAEGKAAEAKEAFRRSLATSTLSAELSAVAEQHLR